MPPAGPTDDVRKQQSATSMTEEAYVTINFGYFHGGPAISQRVVNESVAVAKALNAAP